MEYTDVIDKIWSYAELGFEEYKSSQCLVDFLVENDFEVEKGIAQMETAFVASYGSGKPVISFLCEYDALAGLNQSEDSIEHKPITKVEDNGHGCGHQLLGAGAALAGIQYKNYLRDNNLVGTVKVYGCPGEESGSGKAFMARDGYFKDDDICLTWHPGTINKVTSGSSLSNIQAYYRFYGKSAHAAGAPHLGRSALDAVELMNVGVNFLREHMESSDRIHYAITNTGGESPNVVQSFAEVRYFVRSNNNHKTIDLYNRVNDIAKGAALMTGCKYEIIFFEGLSNLLPNFTLEKVLKQSFLECKPVKYSEDDLAYAQKFKETANIEEILNLDYSDIVDQGKLLNHIKNNPINDYFVDSKSNLETSMGSTDVGDTSWLCPTAQIKTACYNYGYLGHTYQWVAQGKSTIAKKGAKYAADVLTKAAIILHSKPEIIKEARKEFEERSIIGYKCLIPKDAKPENIK